MTIQGDIDFTKAAELGNQLLKEIDRIREIDPIFWSETEQAWVISGHAEVVEAYRGDLPISAERFKLLEFVLPDPVEREAMIGTFMRYFRHFLINLDPPAQLRLRKLLVGAFSKKVADAYRPAAREVICEVLDGLNGRDEIEIVEDMARPITGINIMRIMGFENEAHYLPLLKRWAYFSGAGGSGRPTNEILIETNKCFEEMADEFLPLVKDRKQNPRDDFLSLMVAKSADGDQLTDDEAVANLILVLLAGHDTTLNTIALSIAALADRPEARTYMRANPDKMLNSVMELNRYIGMSTEQGRVVARDFEWQGHQLKAGQLLHIMTAGANRDPRVFFEPETLDLTRSQVQNVTFGPGTHHCIGHFFAKMQLVEFFDEFLKRYDDYSVVENEIPFGPSLTFRGPVSLHMRRNAPQ